MVVISGQDEVEDVIQCIFKYFEAPYPQDRLRNRSGRPLQVRFSRHNLTFHLIPTHLAPMKASVRPSEDGAEMCSTANTHRRDSISAVGTVATRSSIKNAGHDDVGGGTCAGNNSLGAYRVV